MTEDLIRAKIEGLLGWKRGGSNSFSFRTLQSFVRGKDPRFDKGEHIYTNYECPHGRKAGECDTCDVLADLAYDSAREDRRST